MSLIIKGIDLPKDGESIYILLRKDKATCHRWKDIDEEYETIIGKADIEAIQIDDDSLTDILTTEILKEIRDESNT